MSAALQFTREERIAELWRRGELRWKLYPDQREIYDAIRAFLADPSTRYEDYWVDVSRQYGKTFIGLLISVEDCIRNAGWSIGYCAASRTDLWQFIMPNMDVLIADCPDELRPHWDGRGNDFVFPNTANIHLAGVNNAHENDARGPRRDRIVNEECAFYDRYSYLHDSVELPMLTTTGGRILNITTPAETPAHESHASMLKCRMRGRYIQRTIADNKHLSEAAKEKLITQAGGRQSTTARRELFCEWITDETRAIVPEYTEALDAELCATPTKPPTYEQPIVSMDVGFEDWHHILFGYYDFARAKRVVQAEIRLQRATTDKIAAALKETEARLWGGLPNVPQPVRWSDTDLRLIADLEELHRLSFLPTAKDEKEAQVNALRITLKGKGWHIDPACVHLRRQLRLGVWNKARTEFDRSREDGHFDGVDAAIYLNRNIDTWTNPYPVLPSTVTEYTHRIREERLVKRDETDEAFDEAFGRA